MMTLGVYRLIEVGIERQPTKSWQLIVLVEHNYAYCMGFKSTGIPCFKRCDNGNTTLLFTDGVACQHPHAPPAARDQLDHGREFLQRGTSCLFQKLVFGYSCHDQQSKIHEKRKPTEQRTQRGVDDVASVIVLRRLVDLNDYEINEQNEN